MFTIEQIDELHGRLGRATTLFQYVSALHDIGVERYDSFVTDGHSEYFGNGGHTVVSPPAHETFASAETSDRKQVLRHRKLHEQGKATYVEMSRGQADSGIEKWTMDTGQMTMTYFDRAGNALLVEVLRPSDAS